MACRRPQVASREASIAILGNGGVCIYGQNCVLGWHLVFASNEGIAADKSGLFW